MGSWTAHKLIEHAGNFESSVIHIFKNTARQVTYNTFSRTLGTELLDLVRQKMNYVKDKRTGLTIPDDQDVKFYRGYFEKKPALVVEKNNKCMVFTYEAGKFGG